MICCALVGLLVGVPWKNTRTRSPLVPHHVYNRASRGRRVFVDDDDREKFCDLLASRLTRSSMRATRANRKATRVDGAELMAMCLMTSHFHLVVWQKREEGLRRLMQSVLTSYVMYYNRRHRQSGPLFSGPFRSRPLEDAKDLRWTVGYVHANHPTGPGYRFSTHSAYVEDDLRPGWLNTRSALRTFGGVDAYLQFMSNRKLRAELNELFF